MKLPLHLPFHILIMHLYILVQAMEIHRCVGAFILHIFLRFFFFLISSNTLFNKKKNPTIQDVY